MKTGLLGLVYSLNYGYRISIAGKYAAEPENGIVQARSSSGKQNMLVTRAMGGIGDLLMMTPGFHELKKKYPNDKIYLAIPKRFFPVFEGNPDVSLLDIENDHLDAAGYRRWFNFSDCPASKVESRSAPKVTKGRIEIFASSLGLDRVTVHLMEKRPRYFILTDERLFQTNFWKRHELNGKRVIGIQLRSDEVYRDYPHMSDLIARIAQDYHVLVFDAEKILGFQDKNITKVDSLPMRWAFALASACDAIIAPDSAFVHLAAAFDIPCVALYGPIDGHVRTKHYPKCKPLDARMKLGCMPCWRNEDIPCKLTNMRASVCMVDISIKEITQALTEILQGKIRS
jgi:ADP-heptose:LPS heptosyltransferase